MKRWCHINAIGAAATAMIIIASCTVPSTAERSGSQTQTESLPAADNEGEPAAALSTASPSTPLIPPPSTTPHETTLVLLSSPSLTAVPLRIDGLARVIADGLRVRSAPEVSAASERYEPLLDTGTMLFVIDGPVAGSGYDWYEVAPLDDGSDFNEFRYLGDLTGWVASTARDGTPWIVGMRPVCPDPGGFFEDLDVLGRLGALTALSCYAGESIEFRATEASVQFIDGYGGPEDEPLPDPNYHPPMWLLLNFTFWAPPSWADAGLRQGFETVFDPVHFPTGQPELPEDSVWDVVGHFDDQAAADCAHGAVHLTCRTTFVVTSLDRFEGIDPG